MTALMTSVPASEATASDQDTSRTLSITVPLDPETARAYEEAAPQEKRKMQAFIGVWLRVATQKQESLQEVLDDISAKAKARVSPQKFWMRCSKANNCAASSTPTF
jgi:hypothetical protein